MNTNSKEKKSNKLQYLLQEKTIIFILILIAIILVITLFFTSNSESSNAIEMEKNLSCYFVKSSLLNADFLNAVITNSTDNSNGLNTQNISETKIRIALAYAKNVTKSDSISLSTLNYYYNYLYNEAIDSSVDLGNMTFSNYYYNRETQTFAKIPENTSSLPESEKFAAEEQKRLQSENPSITTQTSINLDNCMAFITNYERVRKSDDSSIHYIISADVVTPKDAQELQNYYTSINGGLPTENAINTTSENTTTQPEQSTADITNSINDQSYKDLTNKVGTLNLNITFANNKFVINDFIFEKTEN